VFSAGLGLGANPLIGLGFLVSRTYFRPHADKLYRVFPSIQEMGNRVPILVAKQMHVMLGAQGAKLGDEGRAGLWGRLLGGFGHRDLLG
jgi:hypothetical protein